MVTQHPMMKLEYLAHSSFLIHCGNTRLLFDPWLEGPAYYRQWHLWPLPMRQTKEIDADAILISHGHEDHLHTATLRSLNKNAHVLFPFQWRGGIKPFLTHLGFGKVTEAVSFRDYMINDVKVIYISFSLESVIVIEHKGEVLVNINDALNSNHENAVAFLLKEISERWPRIDYLLSGWSGASYFPNQVKYPGKNDEETGQLREQYFANNFCAFTQYLQPKYSIPFAPGFVLLREENRWINHVKFPRYKVDEYYNEHFEENSSISFLLPYPGDVIENGALQKASALHDIPEDQQYEMAYAHYSREMTEANTIEPATEEELSKLEEELSYWMNFNKQLYHATVCEDIIFSIKLEDAQPTRYMNVHFSGGKFYVKQGDRPREDRKLMINTAAKKLLFALKKVWGGDVLTIGYGLTVDVYDQLTLEKNLDIVCVRLVTRYPIARHDLLKYPLRALRFYSYNPRLTSLWLKQKIRLKPYVNRYPYNERDHWMTYNKCDLCAVCKMPEIDLRAYK